MVSSTRGNPQIWRLAEFIFDAAVVTGDETFWQYQQWYRDRLYDKSTELLKKFSMNEFTGLDDHKD